MISGSTWQQIQLFHVIAKEGSIRGAARRLEMSAPSVSQALKLLEKSIGLPLFLRTTRKLELTEAGLLLLERTRDSMESMELALESVQDLSGNPRGLVKITLPRIVYQIFFKSVFADFCRQYPDVQLEVDVSDATVDIVEQGIDMGIRLGESISENMVARQITPPMKDAIFASPAYLKQLGEPKTLAQLQEHRLIQYRFIAANRLVPLYVYENGESKQIAMETALVVNDTDLMIEAAKQGLGIGRMLEPVVADALAAGELVPVLQEYWDPNLPFYLYFAQHSQKARRVRVLIDFIVENAIKKWSFEEMC